MQLPSIAFLYELFEKHPSVQTDTRKLQLGDLYFALKGPNFNGKLFMIPINKNYCIEIFRCYF